MDYEKNLDESLKRSLNLKNANTHPCLYQKKPCEKGNNCPFLGLPNDTCLYFLTDTCTFGEKCKKRHLEEYKRTYQQTKESLKKKESLQKKEKLVINATCPCLFQHGKCKFGKECNFIGQPNNTCLHFVMGNCTINPCKWEHNEDLRKKISIS